MAKVDVILSKAVEVGASDLHLSVGLPPIIRRFAQLKRFKSNDLSANHTAALLQEILSPEQREHFAKEFELDFAYEIPGVARFRGNAFTQRHGIDLCFRIIPLSIRSMEELGIPDVVKRVCDNHQGLILVTGPAGAGKSTTLAAMVDYVNSNRANHVLTVEDPIEFVHPVKKGVVNQRQLLLHTHAYANALKAALREDPDVIMVGELRDLETISLAISASETGHLVIGSMNTSSTGKTIDKIIDSYPASQQNQMRAMLGESLKAVFSQRLLPKSDGSGVVLGYELLLGSPQLANLIKDGKTFQIPNLMQTGKARGMRLFDDSLVEMVAAKVITQETALRFASNPKSFGAMGGPGAPATFGAPGAKADPPVGSATLQPSSQAGPPGQPGQAGQPGRQPLLRPGSRTPK